MSRGHAHADILMVWEMLTPGECSGELPPCNVNLQLVQAPTPDYVPNAYSNTVDWYGDYLAWTGTYPLQVNADTLYLYKWVNGQLQRIHTPAPPNVYGAAGGTGAYLCWVDDLLVVAKRGIDTYKLTGDQLTHAQRSLNDDFLPGYPYGHSVIWASPKADNGYVVIPEGLRDHGATYAFNFFTMFKRVGDNLVQLAPPPDPPFDNDSSGTIEALAFKGGLIAASHSGASVPHGIAVYQRVGDSLQKVASYTYPSSVPFSRALALNGNYLAAGYGYSSLALFYIDVNAGSLQLLHTTNSALDLEANGLSWVGSTYLASSGWAGSGPGVSLLKLENNALTHLQNFITSGTPTGGSFNECGDLAIAGDPPQGLIHLRLACPT